MAKAIQTIVERINFQAGKRETGYFSPDEIVKEVNAESRNLYNHFIKQYAKSRRISEHLQPFLSEPPATIAIAAGVGTLPTDFRHANAVLAGTVNVEMVELGQWATRLAHPNKPPTASYPICKFDGTKIYVQPTSIASIDLHYFKKPTEAKYAFTISGVRYIYDDANSIDFEWRELVHDVIVERVMANLGISIKDRELIQYSELESKETKV